jgi:hypothetical protein
MVCTAVATALQLPSNEYVIPSSTGVIGWRLPATEIANDIVPKAITNLQENINSAVEGGKNNIAYYAAQAICTTDRYPKVRSKTLTNGARIVGIVKGAGMIEPNMATMLVRLYIVFVFLFFCCCCWCCLCKRRPPKKNVVVIIKFFFIVFSNELNFYFFFCGRTIYLYNIYNLLYEYVGIYNDRCCYIKRNITTHVK